MYVGKKMYRDGAHSARKALGQERGDRELPLTTQKAWSQNKGHENLTTTVFSYLPGFDQQQGQPTKMARSVRSLRYLLGVTLRNQDMIPATPAQADRNTLRRQSIRPSFNSQPLVEMTR